MSSAGSQPPGRVPTLTEVVVWPDSVQGPNPLTLPPDAQPVDADMMISRPPPAAADSLPIEERIVQHVLIDLQRQVDLMLEYRLRETLTPMLNRVADNLVREIRSELASTLRDVVARAVAQELARHRTS
jgi:hypothetical protein